MKRLLVILFATTICGVFAMPIISDLKVTPIEPWGLAIDYNVSGVATNDFMEVAFVANNVTNVAKTLREKTDCVNGAHRVYWNVAKDGITLGETDLNVIVTYKHILCYCVIDLSNGSSADSYPVTYLDAPPSGGFNTTEYKTTKLVLKRVDAGSFKMGNSKAVTLTKPFYMGLYEVTQKQWELVMGSNPSFYSGEANPVEQVSYNMICGRSNSVDSDSFLGKLREKTGIDFDLPTEAQWEYTCRAGTTTTYSYGDSADGDYMWYGNHYSSGSSHEVGTKKANPWGFYDMHGNVWEWCLDWDGSSSGSTRVLCGGGWSYDASHCTSSYRYDNYPSYYNVDYGFRLSRTLP